MSSCQDDRDFETATIALSVGFVVVFWCLLAMGACATGYVKDQELRREVVALRAQGIEVSGSATLANSF